MGPRVGPGELKLAACQSLGPIAGTIRKSQPSYVECRFYWVVEIYENRAGSRWKIANGLEADDSSTRDATRPKGWFFPWDSLRRLRREMIDMPLDDRVLTALERNPYLVRRNLRFETSAGRVTLRGVVNTYFQKQMAQESLRHVDGVDEIANELEVCWV
jgi:BON domain